MFLESTAVDLFYVGKAFVVGTKKNRLSTYSIGFGTVVREKLMGKP